MIGDTSMFPLHLVWAGAGVVTAVVGWAVVTTVVGSDVGSAVGMAVGSNVGSDVGWAVGRTVGSDVGSAVGWAVGSDVGSAVGRAVGSEVGLAVVGAGVAGALVGTSQSSPFTVITPPTTMLLLPPLCVMPGLTSMLPSPQPFLVIVGDTSVLPSPFETMTGLTEIPRAAFKVNPVAE